MTLDVTAEQIEDAINHIKRQLVAIESREISSREIGAMVMHELQRVDQVAYIRFASVYLSFEDIQAFVKEQFPEKLDRTSILIISNKDLRCQNCKQISPKFFDSSFVSTTI